MKFTFLGTGTSQGVPVIGCKCAVCQSDDPKDNRLRSSLLVESGKTTITIDIGPDFRQQMLREKVTDMDAVIFTHEHQDHTAGLDEIRAFNFLHDKPIELHATLKVQERLKQQYAYIFENADYPGIPKISMHEIHAGESFTVGDINILPIKVMHGQMPVLGFRIEDFTYITDANYIGETSRNLIWGSKHLVLNTLRQKSHHSHFTLEEAIELSRELQVEHAYFTHISHQMGKHEEVSRQLPNGVQLAWDGLVVEG